MAAMSAEFDGAGAGGRDRRAGGDPVRPEADALGRARTAARREAARAGEAAAAAHLERNGFTILARNLRVGRDEIDLLALDPDGRTVVVVEVKCRARMQSRPEDHIGHEKRGRLCRAALRLSTERTFARAPFRFDAVSVITAPEGDRIEHWRGAFDASGR